MKKQFQWMLGAFLLVTAALVAANFNARQNPIYRLSRYPKSPAFADYVAHLLSQTRAQTPAATALVGPSKVLLELAYPMSLDYESMLSCQMDTQGNYGWGKLQPARASFGYSAQPKLAPAQLKHLRRLMRALPPSLAPADRYDVVGVVLYDSKPPQIRVYDRRNPPAQLAEICRIIKMPLDLKNYG